MRGNTHLSAEHTFAGAGPATAVMPWTRYNITGVYALKCTHLNEVTRYQGQGLPMRRCL
jgi:hypothetical protein